MCQCDGQPKDVMEVQAITLLEEVGLSKAYMDKYPNMLSGGEAQRVAIARAICINLNIFCLMKPLVHSTCQFKHKY